MDVLEYGPSHYAELSRCWQQYGWNPPDEALLPKKGFVAFAGGKLIGASFVYMSCSGMAFLDWVVVDPYASELNRGKAVFKTIDACKEYAKAQGKQVLYTVTANKALLRSYKKMGFEDMEPKASTMAMSLDGTKTDFLR